MKRNFVIFLTIIFFSILNVNSLQNGYCVNAVVNDITPSSVGVDEEFTVGILIDNCGREVSKNVTFEINKVGDDIIIKDPLKENIGEMGYSNSNRFITYHMRTSKDAKPGIHIIYYTLTYGENQNNYYIKNGNFSITVTAKEAELALASIKTDPALPVKGDTIEMTLRVENSGLGTAKSIKVFADHPFQGVKQTFIGTLESNEDGPAIFTFIADESGEFEFPITISYYDDFGEGEIKNNVNINILKKKSNVWTIILSVIILSIIGWGIFYFFKVKKSKDKIIHQLLKGNNINSDEKDKSLMKKPKHSAKNNRIAKKIKKH